MRVQSLKVLVASLLQESTLCGCECCCSNGAAVVFVASLNENRGSTVCAGTVYTDMHAYQTAL
jgi:hypothetical protein